jgi:hypothetical protein
MEAPIKWSRAFIFLGGAWPLNMFVNNIEKLANIIYMQMFHNKFVGSYLINM